MIVLLIGLALLAIGMLYLGILTVYGMIQGTCYDIAGKILTGATAFSFLLSLSWLGTAFWAVWRSM